MKWCGHSARISAASENWTNMCKVVTKRGAGNPKRSGENIHLLYTDNTVANRYLAETLAV